jgi:hypothetical protein
LLHLSDFDSGQHWTFIGCNFCHTLDKYEQIYAQKTKLSDNDKKLCMNTIYLLTSASYFQLKRNDDLDFFVIEELTKALSNWSVCLHLVANCLLCIVFSSITRLTLSV